MSVSEGMGVSGSGSRSVSCPTENSSTHFVCTYGDGVVCTYV